MTIHLSRGFATVPVGPPPSYLYLKSAAALTLGILPFAIHSIARLAFKALASMAASVNHSLLRQGIGLFAVPTAAVMVASAKLFALTQLLVWREYVRKPEGDKGNTRLAWYGADHLPWQDLKAIAIAFFAPNKSAKDDWSLEEWGQVQI
jgi:hypothetical protein